MQRSVILAEIVLERILRSAGVVVIALLLWLVLSLLSSLFLKKKVGSARGLLNQLRWIFFPALVFYVLVRFYSPRLEQGQPELKIAQTALAAASVILGLGILNLAFAPPVLRRWLRRDVPQLFLDVVRYLLLILAVAVVLKTIWGEDVTPLIGALGIGGIVLGLALQETLSNFFSGLAILAERPFSIGDWVRVGEGVEGKVEHVTWRAVKIRTADNEYIIYPNNLVAKEKVVNFNLPSPVQARRLVVGTSYQDPPDLVKRTIREVLAEAPGVLSNPAPLVFTIAYADFSINYEIKFFIDAFDDRRVIEDGVMSRLWYAFKRRGIEIPFPIRDVRLHGAAPPAPREPAIEQALEAVPIFAVLSPSEREVLARGAIIADYGYGERVIRQGEPGETLYAIIDGQARVAVRGEDAVEGDVAFLKKGDFFGEMSLLTGEPRTATVYAHGELRVVEVRKAALAPVLAAREDLSARIAEVVVLRREGLDRARAGGSVEGTRRQEIAAASSKLLGRIRAFFGLLA